MELSHDVCVEHVLFLADITSVATIKDDTIRKAMSFIKKYHLSFLDSIIVATALDAGCSTLYSEDMRHKQVIENKLTIVNPFL